VEIVMALMEVLHFPDPRLRKKAVPVAAVDEALRKLAADMLETMYAENGVGLAATQVNVQRRIVVIDLSAERNQPLVLVNPEILRQAGSEQSQEGCLSVPGYFDTVERSTELRYRYQTLDGEMIEAEADGLMAICLQHEIDHLNGKLFIDYLSSLKRERIRKKIEKQDRIQAPAL
jgi:peptide deformylase